MTYSLEYRLGKIGLYSQAYPPAYLPAYPSIFISESHNTEKDLRRFKELCSQPVSAETSEQTWAKTNSEDLGQFMPRTADSIKLTVVKKTRFVSKWRDVQARPYLPRLESIIEAVLLMLVGRNQLDSILGDLQESYNIQVQRCGVQRAATPVPQPTRPFAWPTVHRCAETNLRCGSTGEHVATENVLTPMGEPLFLRCVVAKPERNPQFVAA